MILLGVSLRIPKTPNETITLEETKNCEFSDEILSKKMLKTSKIINLKVI